MKKITACVFCCFFSVSIYSNKTMAKKKGVSFVPRTVIPQTPTFMRLGNRKQSILTLCTDGVFGGTKTTGYAVDVVSRSSIIHVINQEKTNKKDEFPLF